MAMSKSLLDALSDFKVTRDALLHSSDDDFLHHLRLFIKSLDSNPLCKLVLARIPPFDVDTWWSAQTQGQEDRYIRLEALDLPENRDNQLSVYLDLARSFASSDRSQISAEGFGELFGKGKRSEKLAVALSVVLRPLADELTRRIRDEATMTNPDVRELAGVPLDHIPADNEIGIFSAISRRTRIECDDTATS